MELGRLARFVAFGNRGFYSKAAVLEIESVTAAEST
jgi:hypothetical protein